ncbi:MAG: penicillin-binding protein, partial [Nitrospirae bacterium]|nr:penicillin-binding protein [Nitrospirota bacterium]
AFGGLVASGRAVAVFLQDQLKARSVLFGREIKDLFYQQQKNNRGKPVPMTLGWHVGRAKGKHYFYKEGGGGGFHGEMRIYQETGIAAVAVANDATFRAGNFLDRICRDFLR